jgi:hypothetical protein
VIEATGHVRTEKATRYVTQLCKHFQHKVQVDWDEAQALVHFPMGQCWLAPDPDGFHVRCRAESAKALATVKYILDDHVSRFGWREKLAVAWGDDADGD